MGVQDDVKLKSLRFVRIAYVLLAHIREQHRLSLNSYGRPRMTEELKELGLNIGHLGLAD